MTLARIDILLLIKVAFIEGLYCIAMFLLYYFSSLMFFGEGNGSFAYTKANEIIFLIFVFGLPFIFNIIQVVRKYKKNKLPKSLSYSIVELGLIAAFLYFFKFF